MKIVFAGPSLAGVLQTNTVHLPADIVVRAPAVQGDVIQAVRDGATAIGLVDGQFEYVAPVWHKELLYALHRGVSVFGASSMGALRAVECEAYGMRGVGKIFEEYAIGLRIDDADVALLHGPSELGYPALTLPLVNVDATLSRALDNRVLKPEVVQRLGEAARRVHFKDRRWLTVADDAGIAWSELAQAINTCWTDQKQLDAIALLQAVSNFAPEQGSPAKREWRFNATPLWRHLYGDPER